jgi:ribosomal protein S18 acetylase RimI-like enzyme
MTITYRPILPADYDAAMQLWNATPGVRTTETRAMFERFLARNPELGCVAECAGALIGAVLCGHDGRRGYLYHLAVAEPFRRQGIAQRLVERCLDDLTRLGIEKCSVFLFTENQAGQAFWSRLGWRERIDLRVMAKELSL